MTPEFEAARDAIIARLLALPWQDRAEVFKSVRFNDFFCCACGYGSVEDPNKNCQCENDE